MGIIFATLALLSWGLGDFLIQKSTRKFGNWVALFYITAFAAVTLFPFVYKELAGLLTASRDSGLLLVAGAMVFLAGMLDFQALKVGNISVVEPIYALEVPITALLAFLLVKERLTWPQVALIASSLVGILLVSTHSFRGPKKIDLEKGVWYALLAALGMGVVNLLFGMGSRDTSPLLINWFTSFFVALVTLAYLAANRRLAGIVRSWREHKVLILAVSLVDNMAWVAYSYSALYIPIAVATSISESYIALAAILGMVFNKESLKRHQWAGLCLAVVSVVVLARTTGN